MNSLGWLHISDFHQGMDGHSLVWPNVRESFFEDLEKLHHRSGPWDLVFFTGDLTQCGRRDEFTRCEQVLQQILEKLRGYGSDPVFVVVPGNHDLCRPDPLEAKVIVLKQWDEHPDIQHAFWTDCGSPYRALVHRCFAEYADWWNSRTQLPKPDVMTGGPLPGDFAATIEKNQVRIGILGVNSAFLQLTQGDYQGRLAIGLPQFHESCGGDGPAWANAHDICFLMSHHPMDWLGKGAQRAVQGDIAPPGRFVAHLFGHMHQARCVTYAVGGALPWRSWQAPSLFSLERYGHENEARKHGYTAGRMAFEAGGRGSLRIWPRVGLRSPEGVLRIVPDGESFELADDQGTRPESIRTRHPIIDPPKERFGPDLENCREVGKLLVEGRTEGFVGRKFIFAGIDRALQSRDFPSGYIVITGEPGIGKTTLLGQLVKERAYIHHFNSILYGIRSAEVFWQNISAQLSKRYGVAPDGPCSSGAAFYRLLAAVEGETAARPLVVAVDAIDEAEKSARTETVLGLLPDLPEGVYFIVTNRELHEELLQVNRRRDIWLRDDDPENMNDIRTYVNLAVAGHGSDLLKHLAHLNVESFVELLVAKSEGNFQYIHMVLPDIAQGRLPVTSLDDIQRLPTGLRAYYQLHWRTMKARDQRVYQRLQRPVLCFLAVAKEPVSITMLARWTGLDEMEIRDLINAWRQFLNVRDLPGGRRYSIYHASFAEFLDDEEGLNEYRRQTARSDKQTIDRMLRETDERIGNEWFAMGSGDDGSPKKPAPRSRPWFRILGNRRDDQGS